MRGTHRLLRTVFLAFTIAAPLAATPAVADENWTVLTMAPDGSWGTATSALVNRAIATAIANCRAAHQREIGCGARSTTIQAGWSLGVRCGHKNIVVAEKTLADAERAARHRESELRRLYVRDMPSCRRVVTVDPKGAIVASPLGDRVIALEQSPSHLSE